MDQNRKDNNGDIPAKERDTNSGNGNHKFSKGKKSDQELEREIFAFSANKKQPEPEENEDVLEGEIIEEANAKEKTGLRKEKNEQDMTAESEQILEEKLAGKGEDSFDKFKNELAEVLRQAGITKRQIIRGCSCLVIVVIVFAAGWFFITGDYFKSRGNLSLISKGTSTWKVTINKIKSLFGGKEKVPRISEPKTEATPNIEISNQDEDLKTAFLAGTEDIKSENVFLDPTIYGGLLTGRRVGGLSDINNGEIQTAILLGVHIKPDMADFEEYVESLRELKNALEVNIIEEMNQSEDREKALMENLTIMKGTLERAILTVEKINQKGLALQADYEELKTSQAEKEKIFFDNLKIFSSEVSNAALSEFISLGKSQVELKANYAALSKVKEYLTPLIKKMQTRITAIELNREILIKGVKVVEIEGSDLELVIKGQGE